MFIVIGYRDPVVPNLRYVDVLETLVDETVPSHVGSSCTEPEK